MFVRGLSAKRLLDIVGLKNCQYIPHTQPILTSSLFISKMKGYQGMIGAEEGSETEFHEIPNPLNTNTVHSDTPVHGTTGRAELPILLRIL